MNTIEAAIRNLEGKITAAKGHAKFHRERLAMYEADIRKYDAAIVAITEVMGGGVVSFSSEKEAPVEEPEPSFPDSLAAIVSGLNANSNALTVAGHGAEVFDRDVIRRELRSRNMHYPVAPCHRHQSQFIRQSLITACTRHPDYDTYLAAGGNDLRTINGKSGSDLRQAIETLGVDQQKVSESARALHRLIYRYGTEGVDYK